MIEAIDGFFGYLTSVGVEKLVRIFWFFFFFEFVRFFLIEITTLLLWRIGKKTRALQLDDARKKMALDFPLVSIIVPGKNEGKHIYKLVKSLREQTYKNFEIIVIDDGSDDDTETICKSLQKHWYIDLFIRNEVRGGKASAANTGFRFSKGRFIVHMDADCSYDNDAIEQIILPFYLDQNIGAVGGNVMVRNYRHSLATTLQAIEYLDTIHIGRITSSYLGIYRVISGAFGAFRTDVLKQVGAWDIGPGLDGDITVKVRKLGYKIWFEPEAICQTSAPRNFKILARQRLRWDKSLIRFRLRKHRDVFYPNASFRWGNFISFAENITYNLILNIKWIFYIIDMLINYSSLIWFIVPFNLLLYTTSNYLKYILFSPFRLRKNVPMYYFLPYIPLMVIYNGYYLRIVRSIAYIQEIFFKKSYQDSWNPQKSSRHAKEMGL